MSRALILPWSGGLDSTALLLDHLDRRDYDAIYTLYIEIPGDKTVCEQIAITQLRSMLADEAARDVPIVWDHQTFKFVEYPPFNANEGILQAPAWLLYLAFYSGHVALSHDVVDIEIGYIRGDCAIRHEERVINAWKGISGLSRLENDPYPLSFPFRGMSKRHIYNRLVAAEKRLGISLINATWTCENPQMLAQGHTIGYTKCGECTPCKRDLRFELEKT